MEAGYSLVSQAEDPRHDDEMTRIRQGIKIAYPSTGVSPKEDDIFVAAAKYCPVAFTPATLTVSL